MMFLTRMFTVLEDGVFGLTSPHIIHYLILWPSHSPQHAQGDSHFIHILVA